MNDDIEKAIRDFELIVEAIVYIKDGRFDRVETPDGDEIPEEKRSPHVQEVVDTYQECPGRVTARLFVYEGGGMGCCIDS